MNAATIAAALVTAEGRADPYPLYAQARGLGPVASVAAGSYLVSGYSAVNQVLRNPGFGVPESSLDPTAHDSLAALTKSVLRANPPEHPRMRSLMSSVFTPRRVADLHPMITDSVDALLDTMANTLTKGRPVDFMNEFAFHLPVSVICSILGVPQTDRRRFRALAADLTVALELAADPAALEPADAAASELSDYFEQLIARTRDNPRDDLLTALVAARDAEQTQLSDLELSANLVVLLVAGFETTTNMLGNAVAILFERPALMTQLRAGELPVAGFVEEVLRYDSPVQATTRVALAEGLVVNGIAIPQGSQLVVLIGSANRDPARYVDPDEFDPTRTGSAPLSFGAGAHVCLGSNLARLEATTALPRLLARFPDLAPVGVPTRRDRLVLRGYDTLLVALRQASGRHDPYDPQPPWDIGRPQPAVAGLVEAGEFRGRVLDVGCGSGDNAVLLACLGLDVTGIDTSDTALHLAEQKADERGVVARFIPFDACRLTDFGGEPFDTVLDCEFFHALDGDARVAYVNGLRAVLRPGGRLFLLCYSTAQPDVPHRISLADLLDTFTEGWQVDTVEPTTLDTHVHPAGARAWLAKLTRTDQAPVPGPEVRAGQINGADNGNRAN